MFRKLFLLGCFLVPLLCGRFALGAGKASPRDALPGSTRDVPEPPTSGAPGRHHPYISRHALSSTETAATLDFEIALKMRNLAELQARVARGELIPPAEMAAKYEPMPADEQAVADWLTSQGFTITRRDRHHLAVFARGKVSQLQQSFQASFARVALEGKEYTSAISAPSLPSTLASVVVGVNGLQPHIRMHRHLIHANSLSGTNEPYLPRQIAQADQASGLYTSGVTGAGQTIAIVIDTFPLASDLTNFWSTYGVNQSLNNITFIQVVAGTLPATEEEETLDTEWSSSIAPGAKVRVYAAASLNSSALDQAYQQVYDDAVAHPEYGLHQMSMSYGIGETYTTKSQVQTDDQYFLELASAGVTCFASSGDGASTPGDSGTNPDTSGPLQVESPASDPYVTGVGGTSLTLASNGNESAETAWQYSGGGVSVDFTRPTWQTGTGLPSGSMRAVPDIAAAADPNTGAVFTYNGAQYVIGGTSWSSPTCAGFCALLNQTRAIAGLAPAGLLGPQIYPLIGSTSFRDITSGSNAVSSTSNGDYSTGTGYDPVTGLGVPLVQALSQALNQGARGALVQPVSQTVAPGQNTTITVTATGTPSGYQWQQMPLGSTTWSNISNNGTFSGATTATLTINGTPASLTGDQFQCVASYASLSALTSGTSLLAVDTPLTVITLAGTAQTSGNSNTAGQVKFNYPSGVAVDASGNIYVADYSNNSIREVTPSGAVSTPYGSTSGTSGSTNAAGNSALFNLPNAVALDNPSSSYVATTGVNLYVADTGNELIREVTLSSGQVTTVAGRAGQTGSTNGTGTSARFKVPSAVAVDSSGNLYVADTGNNLIRKIAFSTHQVTTYAGQAGVTGSTNGAALTQALFNAPAGVAVDSAGNVYVADSGNEEIREITPSGTVSTLAGQAGVSGYLDGPGSKALFNSPLNVAVDSANNVYVTDALVPPNASGGSSYAGGNDLLRKITPAGVVSTLAGQPGGIGLSAAVGNPPGAGSASAAGSANGTGSAAQFYSLQAAVVASSGEVYLADTYNQLVRAAGIAPTIVSAPVSQVITVGQPVTFFVTASGTGTLTYQWLKNNVAISGATGSSYMIGSVAAGDAGDYAVTVTGAVGSVTSSAATLIPVTAQPTAQSVSSGQTVTFSVSPSGSGSFTYQWEFGGSPISGATNSSYSIANVSTANAGSYSVMITGPNGFATTTPVTLTVSPAVVANTDTPTMPAWALALLGLLLFWAATPFLKTAPSGPSSGT